MSKVERCKAEEVYVVGFVPSHMLPKKRPISLDPFLEPLIADIEDGFISGIQVGKTSWKDNHKTFNSLFFWRP